LLLVILLNILDLEQILQAALPFAGGVPIQDNEIDMRNGGLGCLYEHRSGRKLSESVMALTINQIDWNYFWKILFKEFIFNNDTIYSSIRRRFIKWHYH
jgi:hypothetical protein